MTGKKRLRILQIFIFIVVLGTVWYAYMMWKPPVFVKTKYCITSDKITSPIRVAHLSDIHNREYGEGNCELLETVADENPDVIVVTGDMVSSKDEDVRPAVSLIEKLTEIASVYVVYGNHDINNDALYNRNLGQMLEEAGAKVLDFSYEDIDVNGQTVRIGGLYGFCFPEKYLEFGDGNRKECDFLNDFQDTEGYTMLLTHMPVVWLEYEGLEEWKMDCVFSGHSHGGQIVLPILGPVIAPDQGWFPDRVAGLFSSEDGTTQMIVSGGLGDSIKFPRINNDPELVIVDIVPDQKKQ